MTLPSPFDPGRLAAINGKEFDVLVVGGGINGSAAAERLARAGYRVILAERQDFGAGSSSRSSRMMHCGLNYLALAREARGLGRKFAHFRLALKMMRERDRLAQAFPERFSLKTLTIPLRRGDKVGPRAFDLAFALLRLAGGKTPLNYRRFRKGELAAHPLRASLGDELTGLASFSELTFDWPERLCVDYAQSAASAGAVVLNYVSVESLSQQSGIWEAGLVDQLQGGQCARLRARAVVNLTGVWSDRLNIKRDGGAAETVRPNRGCHIAVRLPEALRDIGFVNRNALGHMIMALPWQDLHIIGPSETPLESIDAPLQAGLSDRRYLLDAINKELPDLKLTEDDVLFAWAGMRPATAEAGNPLGIWERRIYRSGPKDAPWFSLSWGRLGDHALSASDALAFVAARLGIPAKPPRETLARVRAETGIEEIVRNEAPATVADVMFGRLGLGWHADHGLGVAPAVAAALAALTPAKSAEDHLADYHLYLAQTFTLAENRS